MHRLLVAEDDVLTREWLSALLRKQEYEAAFASNGEEALAHLRAGPKFDLILLDMVMPILDGWHFLQDLPRPSPPIVVMTGTILTREWAEANDCQGFLRKPFEAEALIAEVRRCLGLTQGIEAATPCPIPPAQSA